MRKRVAKVAWVSLLVAGGAVTGWGQSGQLEAPAGPDHADSAMYTLDAIYQRLADGTPGSLRAGGFAEPEGAPADGGYTHNDIMAAAPARDDADGATAGDVLAGKTFWGLTAGAWGLRTGTGTLEGGSGGPAYPSPVRKTGQTTIHHGGDDGTHHAGLAWPHPRFTDNGDETVTDNLTGLMWTKNVNMQSQTRWDSALDYCTALVHAGYNDWRLPNRFEMDSLLDLGREWPALPAGGGVFTGYASLWYWTSSTPHGSPGHAWLLDVGRAHWKTDAKSQDQQYYIWPVRGGQ